MYKFLVLSAAIITSFEFFISLAVFFSEVWKLLDTCLNSTFLIIFRKSSWKAFNSGTGGGMFGVGKPKVFLVVGGSLCI